MTQEQRVLNPDAYDTLEFAAEAFGGVGAGEWFRDQNWSVDMNCPVCIHGLAQAAAKPTAKGFDVYGDDAISVALVQAGITPSVNDMAVSAINHRLGKPRFERVTFEQWTQQLNVVRGDA